MNCIEELEKKRVSVDLKKAKKGIKKMLYFTDWSDFSLLHSCIMLNYSLKRAPFHNDKLKNTSNCDNLNKTIFSFCFF